MTNANIKLQTGEVITVEVKRYLHCKDNTVWITAVDGTLYIVHVRNVDIIEKR